MKTNLIQLLEKTDEMGEILQTYTDNILSSPYNQNMQEFQNWIQELLLELEDIHHRTPDAFIEGIIQSINISWTDESTDIPGAFSELRGKLNALQNNIDRYYPEEFAERGKEEHDKPTKIFVSHASKDREFIKAFVKLLEFMGIQEDQLFCSSVPGYDIPEGKNIYDYLKEQFDEYHLHMFYMLSDHYYESAAALNEMGAAWVIGEDYTTILLPGFEYQKIDGAVDPYIISAKLDEDRTVLRNHLNQIKNNLGKEFNLAARPDSRWDEELNEFIDKVDDIKNKTVVANGTKQDEQSCRRPKLTIDIGSGWNIKYNEMDIPAEGQIRAEYAPLTLEDIAAGQAYVSQKDLDKYNAELPSKEEVDDYIAKYREYVLTLVRYTEISFDIANSGTSKANDIHIDLQFPDEVRVVERSDIENMQEPSRPQKPESPLERTDLVMQHLGEIAELLQKPIYPISVKFSDFGIEINDNCIHISLDNLQHNRRETYDQFAVVPQKRGRFRVDCKIMCDEYIEPIEQRIDLIVD